MATSAEIRRVCSCGLPSSAAAALRQIYLDPHTPGITSPSHHLSPLKVQFELTRRCNLSCIHCYNESGSAMYEELTRAEWGAIARECVEDLNVCHISITGGEPFLLPHLVFDLLDLCETRGTAVSITTNGTLITEKIAARLARYRSLFKVQVSLDGAEAESHDAIRGRPGAWEAAVRAMGRLRRLPICLAAAGVLMKPNLSEIESMVTLAFYLGSDRVSFAHLMELGRARRQWQALAVSPNEYRRVMAQLRECGRKYGDSLAILLAYDNALNWHADFAVPNATCLVRADGQVVPRCYVSKPWGSLRETTLADIWKRRLMKAHEDNQIRTHLYEEESRG